MRLLLDTQVFLWAADEPERLGDDLHEALRDPRVPVHVSAASAWELAIKASLGKIELPAPADRWLLEAVEALHFSWLSIAPTHAVAVTRLPPVHRDPFDRLLVAQAQSGFTLVSADARLAEYPVDVWVA